ncbi:MAG: T9SS C-terminal target domain-containing protein [Candidatus Zixiibacteriota bacterium]|nr:MAG: T9SS C-terminal target domain-containing protein [candidate division Zixibacteria bacterium]
MQRSILASVLLAALFTTSIQAQPIPWEYHRMPGGSEEETIIVDETLGQEAVKGLWITEKQGGMYWTEWNSTSNSFDPCDANSEFDAHYPWCMGADVHSVGGTYSGLYTVAATYNATQWYKHFTGEPSNWGYESNLPIRSNNLYRWHDALLVADGSGNFLPDQYVVSAMQEWSSAAASLRKGLYVCRTGNSTPVLLTDSDYHYDYRSFYRDLDDGKVFYTFYNATTHPTDPSCAFQKWTMSGTGPSLTGSSVSDFASGYVLKEVGDFYQYIEPDPSPGDNDVRHQFLEAESKPTGGDYTWDVWHREKIGSTGTYTTWTKILSDLGNINAIRGTKNADIVAYRPIGGDYHIYLGIGLRGLVLVKGLPSSTWSYTLLNGSISNGFLYRSGTRSLNLRPRSWVTGSSPPDQVIVGGVHGGLQVAKISLAGPSVDSYVSLDNWGGGVRGTAQKAGSYVFDVVANGPNYYFFHDALGVFKAATSSDPDDWVTYTRLGLSTTDLTARTDFNICLRNGCFSPFPGESNILYLGGQDRQYINGLSSTTQLHRGGMWKLDISSPTNSLTRPADISLLVETGKLSAIVTEDAGAGEPILYYASPSNSRSDDESLRDEGPYNIYRYKQGSPSTVEDIWDTDAIEYTVYHWLAGPLGENMHAGIFCLEAHPTVKGVVYGLSMPAPPLDWDDLYQGTENGGGLGYVYRSVVGPPEVWTPEPVVQCHNAPDYFQNVVDMVAEYPLSPAGADHQKVDMLVACAAFELSHKSEDPFRYGGLFKVHYGGSAWQVTDVTPPVGSDYRLSPASGAFSHPAVVGVDSVALSASSRIYVCVTSGEDNSVVGLDEWTSHVWYQRAAGIANLTASGWRKFPSPIPSIANGIIPYTNSAGETKPLVSWGPVIVNKYHNNAIDLFVGGVSGIRYTMTTGPVDQSQAWEGMVILDDNVTVNNGATLTLNPGCQIVANGDFGITVDSGYIKVAYPDSDRVVFTAAEGVRWEGLTFKNMHPDSTPTVENLEIRNADVGIYIDDNATHSVRLTVQNCLFDGNSTAIAASQADRLRIANCTIRNCVKDSVGNGDGIYLFNPSAGVNHIVENNEIYGNDGCGVRLSSCPATVVVRNNAIHDNLEQNSAGYTTWAGVYCYNSSPKVLTTEVSEANGYPLAAFNSAAPYLCPGPDSTNRFELTMSPPDTYAVIFADGGFPVMNNAHNNFSHAGSGSALLIRDVTSSPPLRTVKYNWWGVSSPATDQYSPTSIDYTPCLTSAEGFPTGLPARGIYTEDSTAYGLLADALAAAEVENYALAYQLLVTLMETYPNEGDAVCQALPHLYNNGLLASIPATTLYAYLDNLYLENPGTLVGKTARKVRNDCAVYQGNYQAALNDYQAIMADPETLADSVYAAIDANQVNLILSGSGMPGIMAVGPLNPGSAQECMKREAQLMALLYGSGGPAGPALPQSFALHQNFPNPFNPVTTIQYDLPELSQVKITIYNMLGQKVVTLADGLQTAGYKKVMWDSQRAGVVLASGIYVYHFEATGKVTGKTFTTAKKMLLLK